MKTMMLLLALHLTHGSVQPVATLRSAPANGWIGYAMATRAPTTVSCCDGWGNWSKRCDGCHLDGDDSFSINSRDKDDIGPAGASQLYVFTRFDDGVPGRIRIFSPTCELDAGGQTVNWVDNVSQGESIAFLRKAAENGAKKLRNGALLALSLHAGATDTLIELARRNSNREIRGQALFWLSQQAGTRAAEALKDAVENDPEESVRAKAVFGISQLPNDESIPLLVDLMKHNRSREVRKKAAFWLGQKNDPRALAAIEEILRN